MCCTFSARQMSTGEHVLVEASDQGCLDQSTLTFQTLFTTERGVVVSSFWTAGLPKERWEEGRIRADERALASAGFVPDWSTVEIIACSTAAGH